MKLESIQAFLVKARRNTYATGGGKTKPFIPNSEQLEYIEGNLLYRDVYNGGKQFYGFETIYHNTSPIWSMVYGGGTLLENAEKMEESFTFLRFVLSTHAEKVRICSSFYLQKEGWSYECKLDEGNAIDRFNGKETISENGVIIYRLGYCGGVVK